MPLFITTLLLINTNFSPLFNQMRQETQKVTTKKTFSLKPAPPEKTLKNDYFVSQTFNNCGPASLSMILSYFDIQASQEALGQELRPYQNPEGDNDDKSVTLDELAEKSKDFDLIPYHRPNGNITILKQFIHYDIPVITLTWMGVGEDIGHYRIVKGYNDKNNTIIQDDPYNGPNLTISYKDFDFIWEKYNYEYLALIPKNKKEIAKKIIGKSIDEKKAWEIAQKRNEKYLTKNPSDIYARFNLVVSSYYLNNYKKSVNEFEKIENELPSRTLWYQIEPIKAYYYLGNYYKVLALTDSILNNDNMAFSELYILRGKIYQKQGKLQAARTEFENAVYYNSSLKEAKSALKSLSKDNLSLSSTKQLLKP